MKSLTLALCVIALLASAASTFFYFDIGKKKEQLQQQVASAKTASEDLQLKLNTAEEKTDSLQKQLLSTDNERAEAVSKSAAAESRNALLSRDVSQLRNQLTAKEDAAQTLNREISELKRDLAQAKLAATAGSPEEIDGYKTTIATLQARLTQLEPNRGNVTSKPNTGAGNTDSPRAVTAIQAEVVSIGAQDAFVVINIGSGKGVQAGQSFLISRNGNPVATAQISTVQENYSIAQVAASSLRSNLSKGDNAALTQ